MEIDWVTFSAQIVNLIVLGWLLKRFLYKPVLNAIDAREKSISDRVNEAKNLSSKAKDELSDLKKKKDDFEKERYTLLNKTKEECEELKNRLTAEAKSEVNAQKKLWLNDLEKQKSSFFDMASEEIIKSFMNFADKSLKDLAKSNLEEQMIAVFKEKIKNLPLNTISDFKENAVECGKIAIYSAFEIKNNDDIETFVRKTFNIGNDVVITFNTDRKLICGIELSAKEKSLSWSMKEHLNNFKAELKSALSGE